MPEHKDLLQHALLASRRAADYIRSVDNPPDASAWGVKGTSDFVTQIDRDAERIIADTLLDAYPTSVVLGEELSPGQDTAQLTWVVDPLDGTTNFLHGYPTYAVSVAAVVAGRLCVGVVTDVARDRIYHATAGGGAWCNHDRIHVSDTFEIQNALIGTGFPFKAPALLARYLRQFSIILAGTSGVRRAGAAALDLVDVASGRFDGFWELSLAPWDVAAGALLVREAGGVVTNVENDPDVVRAGSIVAGNPTVHDWLLHRLRDVAE
ncbi:MAG: inositol monophosphatase family protein [Gemmatimonadales bacterium]